MTETLPIRAEAPKAAHPRDLQARLYREIGISAVSAALRFTTQPEPGRPPAGQKTLPPLLSREAGEAAA